MHTKWAKGWSVHKISWRCWSETSREASKGWLPTSGQCFRAKCLEKDLRRISNLELIFRTRVSKLTSTTQCTSTTRSKLTLYSAVINPTPRWASLRTSSHRQSKGSFLIKIRVRFKSEKSQKMNNQLQSWTLLNNLSELFNRRLQIKLARLSLQLRQLMTLGANYLRSRQPARRNNSSRWR